MAGSERGAGAVPLKFTTTLAPGSTVYHVDHKLHSRAVHVTVFGSNSPWREAAVQVDHVSTTRVTLTFAVALSASHEVVVTG